MPNHATFHAIAVLISFFMVVHSVFKLRAASHIGEKDGWCLATIAWICVVLLEIFHHLPAFKL
jgi:hypothetical protein